MIINKIILLVQLKIGSGFSSQSTIRELIVKEPFNLEKKNDLT